MIYIDSVFVSAHEKRFRRQSWKAIHQYKLLTRLRKSRKAIHQYKLLTRLRKSQKAIHQYKLLTRLRKCRKAIHQYKLLDQAALKLESNTSLQVIDKPA